MHTLNKVVSQEDPDNPDVIDRTPYGRSANVNNSTTFNSTPLYLKVKRDIQSPFVITDLAIVIANKGEEEPLGYSRLNENLNRGMVGSTVYIAFKQRPKNVHRASYRPSLLARMPRSDHVDQAHRALYFSILKLINLTLTLLTQSTIFLS